MDRGASVREIARYVERVSYYIGREIMGNSILVATIRIANIDHENARDVESV